MSFFDRNILSFFPGPFCRAGPVDAESDHEKTSVQIKQWCVWSFAKQISHSANPQLSWYHMCLSSCPQRHQVIRTSINSTSPHTLSPSSIIRRIKIMIGPYPLFTCKYMKHVQKFSTLVSHWTLFLSPRWGRIGLCPSSLDVLSRHFLHLLVFLGAFVTTFKPVLFT